MDIQSLDDDETGTVILTKRYSCAQALMRKFLTKKTVAIYEPDAMQLAYMTQRQNQKRYN